MSEAHFVKATAVLSVFRSADQFIVIVAMLML